MSTRCSCRCRRPTSRRSRSRRRTRTRICCSSPGPARRRARCGVRSTSRASSTRRPWSRGSPSGRRGGATAMRRARRRSSSSRTTSPRRRRTRSTTGSSRRCASAARSPDIFTPDGFVAAQMLVPRDREGRRDDVGKMISALEGCQFLAPKGLERIRPEDHALLQPMFQVAAHLAEREAHRQGPEGGLARQRPAPGQAVPRLSTAGGGATSTRSSRPGISGSTSAAPRSSPMSRSRSAEGEFLGHHRAERRGEDVAVQPADRAVPADGGPGRARRPGHHARAAVPPHPARASAGRSSSRASSRA